MRDQQQGKTGTGCSTYRSKEQSGNRKPFTLPTATHPPGFTLIEMLVAISIAGILVAIAAPSWISWRNMQRITTAQEQAFQVMRQAQARAMTSRLEWRISFREMGQAVQWASHPSTVAPTGADWQSLPAGIQIDAAETTLAQASGIYRVEFTNRGHANPPLGRITFMAAGDSRSKRCVVVSTVLGTLRKASDNRVPDDGGRYCY